MVIKMLTHVFLLRIIAAMLVLGSYVPSIGAFVEPIHLRKPTLEEARLPEAELTLASHTLRNVLNMKLRHRQHVRKIFRRARPRSLLRRNAAGTNIQSKISTRTNFLRRNRRLRNGSARDEILRKISARRDFSRGNTEINSARHNILRKISARRDFSRRNRILKIDSARAEVLSKISPRRNSLRTTR